MALDRKAAKVGTSAQSEMTAKEVEKIRYKALHGGPGTMVEEDRPYREFDDGKIRVWGYTYDSEAVKQIRTVASQGRVDRVALMADNHLGYSMPIGGVAAYREMVSPSGVGYDIGCGVYSVRTNVRFEDIAPDIERIGDEIFKQISFGIGRKNPTPVDHELFDSETWQRVPYLTQPLQTKKARFTLRDRAYEQLGTVGSGNHYCDLLVEPETGLIWIATHFGSRGFGHGIASGFLNLAAGREFSAHATEGESMHALPTLLPLTREAASIITPIDQDFGLAVETGQQYKEAMELAGQYAYAGREFVVGQVLKIIGAEADKHVHNHHNFAWTEEIDGEQFEVVRKGATPAYPGQMGFIGGSMGDISVVVSGVDDEGAAKALHSTVHGAGRIMSRSRAKGNRKGTRKGEISAEMMFGALANFRKESGLPLVLRGGGVDESPFVYRQLQSVLDAHVATGTIRVDHTLVPVTVCMAGEDIVDPFKD